MTGGLEIIEVPELEDFDPAEWLGSVEDEEDGLLIVQDVIGDFDRYFSFTADGNCIPDNFGFSFPLIPSHFFQGIICAVCKHNSEPVLGFCFVHYMPSQ